MLHIKTLGTLVVIGIMAQNLHANDSSFGGTGSLPIPIANDVIAMMAEKIEIIGEDLQNVHKVGRWNYTCQFTFKNFSEKQQTLQMGFPFPLNNENQEISVPQGESSEPGDPLVYDFKVTSGGVEIPAVRSKIGPNKKDDMDYRDAYLWPMSFAPQQTLEIEHRYTTGTTYDVEGFTWAEYVLKTGALWRHGQIGHTQIIVKPNTPTKLCTEISNYTTKELPIVPGIKVVGEGKERSYVWDLYNFEPKSDLFLCLQTGRDYVRFQIVYALLGQSNYESPLKKKMTTHEKRLLKNSIFAQYGRTFKDPELQNYFNQQWWYEPNPDYNDFMLNKEDKAALKQLE